MKRSYVLIIIVVTVLSLQCQKEISNGSIPVTADTKAPITATLQGIVVNENGQPATGVQVKAGNTTATTDSRGYFRIIKAALDKNASVVIAEKSGYFRAYRTFQATTGANHISIKLIKRTLAGTINSSAGGEVTLTNGAKVALPVNAVVKAAGGSYSGTINVYAAYIDPSSSDIAQTIPGSFMANDKNGNRVALASYGMLAVELESASGEKLQIAADKTATLTTPIPAAAIAAAPSTISLWYMDEQTGLWKEEGTATKNGNNYIGDVKHFSFWNCDAGFPGINLLMTLKNNEGTPLVHVCVRLTRQINNWTTTSFGYTDSLGKVSGLVPANETLILDVMNNCGQSVYSQNVGPYSQNTDLGTITVAATSASLLTIKGKLLNCSGTAVSNGYAIISYDNFPHYITINSSGEFSISATHCSGSSLTCDITGVDNTTQQQGTVTGISIVTPITDAGNITACGLSTAQFINYTLDGTNYSLSSANAADSLSAFTYQQGTVPYLTYMNGYNVSSNNQISLNFSSNSIAAGTYTISRLNAQNFNASIILSPSNVTVTNFPQSSAGYYEGNFSGSFKDSANLTTVHAISGSFRLRRY